MKKFLIIAVFTFSIIFLNSSNTYAYSIETLDSNPDLHEISQNGRRDLPLGARRSRR